MRNVFHEQLDQLNVELIKMGAMCEEAISAATKAYLDGDKELGQRAVQLEQDIDHKERDIESQCMNLLLRQQPVASDLRVVSAAMRMISDMERIGDQASDIAEIAVYLADSPLTGQIHIKDMAVAAIHMVTDSVDAFVRQDLALARSVAAQDDTVDNYFDQVKRELIDLMMRNSSLAEQCIDLIMVAKYLERIGDHAVNISEWVEYAITGTHSAAPEDQKA